MPLYDFRCNTCDKVMEMLAKPDHTPSCPECGDAMEKLVSRPATPGTSAGIIASARKQAAKEGHFSNYSAKEKKRI
jgi:putative FmdB family regulatory protein